MRKVSFNFSDFEHEEFTALAKRDGKPFSEVVRHALDEWLMAKKGGTPVDHKTQVRQGVTVIFEDSDRDTQELQFEDATAEESHNYNGINRLHVTRGEKTIASFDLDAVRTWYVWE